MKNPAILLFVLTFVFSFSVFSQQQKMKTALTFDDLPLSRMGHYPISETGEILNRIITGLKARKLTAIGFVNENKLFTGNKYDSLKINLIQSWIDGGFEIGNHTFSHPDINKVSVYEYEKDIINGENIIRKLADAKGIKLKYFRHPYLHTGMTADIKNEIEQFLAVSGYLTAPVTIDNSESTFALAYDNAIDNGDTLAMRIIGEEYIIYLNDMFEYYERQSLDVFGRVINQVLLLHSNNLNSVYLSDLCDMIEKRGYEITSLDEALKDVAYESKDEYTGKKGISWIQRWAISMGLEEKILTKEPDVPEYIRKYSKK